MRIHPLTDRQLDRSTVSVREEERGRGVFNIHPILPKRQVIALLATSSGDLCRPLEKLILPSLAFLLEKKAPASEFRSVCSVE